MKTAASIHSLEERFKATGIDNARRVAEELIAHVLDCKPLEIYLRDEPVPDAATARIGQLADRVIKGEPLQYVIGHVDFMGLKIKCDQRALIPRPETELLVEEVLNSGCWTKHAVAIVDVGTGSGCIALSLAQAHPEAGICAVDRSPDALELAKENARMHGMEGAIQWKENHLLDGFPAESFHGIVANLPYIASSSWKELSPCVRDHEPQSALDSGPSGMELIEELALQARTVLVSGGRLFLEFGYDQGRAVSHCLEAAGYHDIVLKQDLAGLDRMATAVNPPC